MTPRLSSAIRADMECLKTNFDKRYFKGQPLTREYKKTLIISWQLLQVQLTPLVTELHECEEYERKQATALWLQEASRPLWFDIKRKIVKRVQHEHQ